jgi:hypothetical protein
MASVSGLLGRNAYVYEQTTLTRVSRPNIRVRPVEFYGQCGEDLILVALLRAEAAKRQADLANEHYLEVGGNHPFATSPTYLMQRQLDMTGVIVEANPALLADLRKGRPRDTIVHGAVQTEDVDTVTLTISKLSEISSLNSQWVERWAGGTVGVASRLEVPALRMNALVERFLAGRAPCFLSVDVETLDLQLLRDFDFERYRPWLVQAEPSDHFLPGEANRMIEHMGSAGYTLVAKTDVNLIFLDARP